MGSLTLPASGLVYADTQVIIYSVEKHPTYAPLLRPLWRAIRSGALRIVSSELTVMEALVGPYKVADAALEAAYEKVFRHRGVRLDSITGSVLREAARLRATIPALRTPDAIHGATATQAGAALFVTNDAGFRRIPGLPLALLDDVLAA